MEIRNVEDCFKVRILRRIKPDKEKSIKSLEISNSRLERAKQSFKIKIYYFVVLESYMAMFHAARALLYKDGVQEKSHYALSIYLKEKYSNRIPIPILNYLDIHRTERHEAMYGLEYVPTDKDAEIAINDAEIFIREVKKILK